MQITTASPRDLLTDVQVRDVVAGNIVVDVGADLLDADGTLLEDVSADVVPAGQIVYGAYRTIHRTCQVQLARELSWGTVRLRPWMDLTAGGVTVRTFLGVFLLDTPVRQVDESSDPVWQADGYDLLAALDSPVGATYQVAAGTGLQTAVEAAVAAAGVVAPVVLTEVGDAPATAEGLTWALRDGVTWLRVVNDLLDQAGYRSLRADEAGRFRSQPYRPPTLRPVEWVYDATASDTTVVPDAAVEQDLFDVPNRWVFWVDDPERGEPTAGTTLYEVVNQSDGVTSIDQRGRIISAVHATEAADFASLVAAGDAQVERARQSSASATVTVGPNPLHGHFDIVRLTWPAAGVAGRWQVVGWTLPLDGSDMTLELRKVDA